MLDFVIGLSYNLIVALLQFNYHILIKEKIVCEKVNC
jgi:hypothetical protein